jgi:predicted dithiol-disulfide oxidoreductase (DUF899 family)
VTGHKVGTRDEWQAARDELAKLEAEQAARNEEIKRKRARAPLGPGPQEVRVRHRRREEDPRGAVRWPIPALAYNIMYGPDYEAGACPGCTSLADGFDGQLMHLNKRNVTFLCFSRAPIDRLAAYKKRMGWQFPYVSTYGTDFPFDFGLAWTEEKEQQIPRGQGDGRQPAGWLQEWSEQIGAELKDGLRENPGYIAFARENGTVYHTSTTSCPPRVRRSATSSPASSRDGSASDLRSSLGACSRSSVSPSSAR